MLDSFFRGVRVFFPIRQYTASVSGSARKRVHCETCGADYVYEVGRHENGTAGVGPRMDNDDAREDSRHLIGIGLVLLRLVLARNLDPNANYSARANRSGEAVLVSAAPVGAAPANPPGGTSG